MEKKDVLHLAFIIDENFHNNLNNLISDIKFFTEYMKRSKTSPFCFKATPVANGTYKIFNDIWSKYGCSNDDLDIAYAEFIVFKHIVKGVYDEDELHPIDLAKALEFLDYFEKYNETKVDDYVGEFVGCSRGTSATIARINELRRNNML